MNWMTRGFTAAFMLIGFGMAANAQVLILDSERVESEAAAYKDFRLQTVEYQQTRTQLLNFIGRSGDAERLLVELEQQKSIIGNEEYERRRAGIKQQYDQAQIAIARIDQQLDLIRQEAIAQIERARQPVIRSILSERNAQVIMNKRSLVGHSAGLDITTEYIERLDAELSQLDLNVPDLTAGPAPAEAEGGEGGR